MEDNSKVDQAWATFVFLVEGEMATQNDAKISFKNNGDLTLPEGIRSIKFLLNQSSLAFNRPVHRELILVFDYVGFGSKMVGRLDDDSSHSSTQPSCGYGLVVSCL